jgi:hypothetical protein
VLPRIFSSFSLANIHREAAVVEVRFPRVEVDLREEAECSQKGTVAARSGEETVGAARSEEESLAEEDRP